MISSWNCLNFFNCGFVRNEYPSFSCGSVPSIASIISSRLGLKISPIFSATGPDTFSSCRYANVLKSDFLSSNQTSIAWSISPLNASALFCILSWIDTNGFLGSYFLFSFFASKPAQILSISGVIFSAGVFPPKSSGLGKFGSVIQGTFLISIRAREAVELGIYSEYFLTLSAYSDLYSLCSIQSANHLLWSSFLDI